jgi:hypothetical protein
MFVHDPGTVIAIDSQDAALQFGIGMGADSLLEGDQEAVGQAFKGGFAHFHGRSTGLPDGGQHLDIPLEFELLSPRRRGP